MTYGSSIFTSWFQLICGSQRSQLEFVLWWCGPKNSSGSFGVTGVKRSIFTKKASSPSEYIALTRFLCICISLINSTKVMVLKIHPGSFGVKGVKGHFH